MFLFFFFQAKAGIRDLSVPGVQACALPLPAGRHRRPLLQVVAVTAGVLAPHPIPLGGQRLGDDIVEKDRKSTRLNSSHSQISYAVLCLKKKKKDSHRAEQITARLPRATMTR